MYSCRDRRKNQGSRMAFSAPGHHFQSHGSSLPPPLADGTSRPGTMPLPDNSSCPQKLPRAGLGETTKKFKYVSPRPGKSIGKGTNKDSADDTDMPSWYRRERLRTALLTDPGVTATPFHLPQSAPHPSCQPSAHAHLGGHDQLVIHDVVWCVAHAKQRARGVQVAGHACADVHVLPDALPREACLAHLFLDRASQPPGQHRRLSPSALQLDGNTQHRCTS